MSNERGESQLIWTSYYWPASTFIYQPDFKRFGFARFRIFCTSMLSTRTMNGPLWWVMQPEFLRSSTWTSWDDRCTSDSRWIHFPQISSLKLWCSHVMEDHCWRWLWKSFWSWLLMTTHKKAWLLLLSLGVKRTLFEIFELITAAIFLLKNNSSRRKLSSVSPWRNGLKLTFHDFLQKIVILQQNLWFSSSIWRMARARSPCRSIVIELQKCEGNKGDTLYV